MCGVQSRFKADVDVFVPIGLKPTVCSGLQRRRHTTVCIQMLLPTGYLPAGYLPSLFTHSSDCVHLLAFASQYLSVSCVFNQAETKQALSKIKEISGSRAVAITGSVCIASRASGYHNAGIAAAAVQQLHYE